MTLFSFENVYQQYLDCRRGKRKTANTLRFEARQERHLLPAAAAERCGAGRPDTRPAFAHAERRRSTARVVVQGTPEAVVASGSHTGVALRPVLARV